MNSNGNPKQTPGTKKPGRGGARPGAGRKKGAVEPQTLVIREIARSITLGNPKVVARLTREAESGSINPGVLISLIDRGWGRPIPMEPEVSTRQSLVFISKPADGLHMPWCWANDASRESNALIVHGGPCRVEKEPDAITAGPAAIKALEEAQPPGVVIDTKAGDQDKDGEPLELIDADLPEHPSPRLASVRRQNRPPSFSSEPR
jgi:hypothetical protein